MYVGRVIHLSEAVRRSAEHAAPFDVTGVAGPGDDADSRPEATERPQPSPPGRRPRLHVVLALAAALILVAGATLMAVRLVDRDPPSESAGDPAAQMAAPGSAESTIQEGDGFEAPTDSPMHDRDPTSPTPDGPTEEPRAPEPQGTAPDDLPLRTVTVEHDLVQAFRRADPDVDPEGTCFGPGRRGQGRVAYLRIEGIRYEQNHIQCGGAESADADAVYRFRRNDVSVPAGATIVAVLGNFVVDESVDEQRGAEVEWVVRFAGTELCRTRALWGRPGQCNMPRSHVVDVSGYLEISQRVVTASPAAIWAGVHHPKLRVQFVERNTSRP